MQSNNDNEIDAFRWVGSESMLLDVPSVISCGRVLVGRYGGRLAAGANKNEDGALVWSAADGTWEFALIIDAHYSAESAELLLQMVQDERHNLLEHLRRPDDEVFALVHEHLVSVLMSPEFRARCREVEGEASCIFCVRKGSFLWWMSVGDCVVYLLHPELARLGQFALNQRSYYEWVGRRNTFDLEVPCYTSGVKELQPGRNLVVMLTDGLLECGKRPFEDPLYLYKTFTAGSDLALNVQNALKRVHQERGGDSSTVIAWQVQVS